MEVVLDVLAEAGKAGADLLLQPFFYLAAILAMAPAVRKIRLGRKLHHAKLLTVPSAWWRAALWGLAAALLVSAAVAVTGVRVRTEDLWWLWGASLALSLIRIRHFHVACAVGAVGVLHLIAGRLVDSVRSDWAGLAVLRSLADIHFPSLVFLAALIMICAACLVRVQGAAFALPIYTPGKRGKPVGGFLLNGLWPLPLVLLVPDGVAPGTSLAEWFSWQPLFGGDGAASGWRLLAFPLFAGFSEWTVAYSPREKAKRIALRTLAFGLALLAAAVVALAAGVWAVVAAVSLAALAGHELVWRFGQWEERQRPPLYTRRGPGLQVLDVIPGSPAAELGIRSGEVLVKVNGAAAGNTAELHAAMALNPAYVRMEVLDHAGEKKFLKRGLFAGEHHLLGLIPVPDDSTLFVLDGRQYGLLRYARSWLCDVKNRLPGLSVTDSAVAEPGPGDAAGDGPGEADAADLTVEAGAGATAGAEQGKAAEEAAAGRENSPLS